MSEYMHEWNKCSNCGYMERKAITRARVLNVLAPDQLLEPFVEPITSELRDRNVKFSAHCEDIEEHKKAGDGGCSPSS